jgi:hypothetical protein
MTREEIMQALHSAMDALAPLEEALPQLPCFAQVAHFARLRDDLEGILEDLHCARLDLGSVAHRLESVGDL